MRKNSRAFITVRSEVAGPSMGVANSESSGPANLMSGNQKRLLSVIAQLVTGSLCQYRRIDALDRSVRTSQDDPFDRPIAVLLREAYDRWAVDAEALLDRAAELGREGRELPGFEELGDAVGRTRAFLSVTLESMDRAEKQIERGEVTPLAEVRRELRARYHS